MIERIWNQMWELPVREIARRLSNTCRFGGSVKKFYSTAQHSCVTADLTPRSVYGVKSELWALLHDAPEAVLFDAIRPIKPLLWIKNDSGDLERLDDVEVELLRIVAERFELPWPVPAEVWEADDVAADWELRDVALPGLDPARERSLTRFPLSKEFAILPLSSLEALELFCRRFEELSRLAA